MRIARTLVVASLVGLACISGEVLALSPAAALAAAPTVTSVSPNEGGSAGKVKVIIHGTGFTAAVEEHDVLYAGVELKKTTTNPAPEGDFRVISETEIEINTPFHERENTQVRVCTGTGHLAENCSSEVREPSNEFIIWPEVYKNEVALGAGHGAALEYGQILFNSPQQEDQFECVNVSFGAGWNEPLKGRNAISAHGEILVWWASGHTPKGTHTELSSHCRFIDEGQTQNHPNSPTVWMTAEPPLHNVTTQGEVCINRTISLLVDCPKRAGEPGEEREITTVIREVQREGLSLPWNIQFTERSEKSHVRIGLPDICRSNGSTELSTCPEASEREPSQNPEACTEPLPDPPGCVKLQVVSNAPLNLHQEYEGYVEPKWVNGGPNGLSPSSWEFEGSALGEPVLRLRETPSIEFTMTGSVKIIGFSGQELITVK